MSDEIKRPDCVLVVARDPENPLSYQEQRRLAMWLEGSPDMISNIMMARSPIDLYQLIDGRWSFAGEPREAKPFMVDDDTMMVPMHEKACDYEWIGFVMYRKVDGYWRKTEAKRLDGPAVPYRDPFAETRDDRRKRLQEQFDRTGKMEISVCSENFTPTPLLYSSSPRDVVGMGSGYSGPPTVQITPSPDAKKTDGFSFETTAHGDQFASLPIGPTEHYTFSAPAQFGLIGPSDFDSISGRATKSESKAHGVPIGYDIEVSDSPQPTAEEEAQARELAKSSKDMVRTQTDRPRGIIAQTGGRPISVVERPTEPPKQETDAPKPIKFREFL